METKNIICLLIFLTIISSLCAQNNCVDETIVYKEGNNFFALSNAFTPNNDGINDLLLVFNSVVNQRRIIISDTTGITELFKTEDVDTNWDGRDIMGEAVPEGEYLLTLNYQFVNGDVVIGCRSIYLIRENCLDLNADSLDFPIDFNNEELKFNANTVTLSDCVGPVSSSTPDFSLSIFPNPVNELLYINTSTWLDDIKIYESTGKLVYQQNDNVSNILDVSGLQRGIYVLQLNSQQSKIYHRFLVQ